MCAFAVKAGPVAFRNDPPALHGEEGVGLSHDFRRRIAEGAVEKGREPSGDL